MHKPPLGEGTGPSHRPVHQRAVHQRLRAVMAHLPRYAFDGPARLARDAGVSAAAVSRLLAGRSNPSFALAWSVAKALEAPLGRPLDPAELFSLSGTYPTASACALVGCRGCALSPDDRATS